VNHMNRFVLKNTFIKIYVCRFLLFFYKNKKSKLCFGADRFTFQNDFFFATYREYFLLGLLEPAVSQLHCRIASLTQTMIGISY
jgi:hypothetical protein